jgi:hypothetical protein
VQWYINELSLVGQYLTAEEFRTELEPLLRLRQRSDLVRKLLYCSWGFSNRLVTTRQNVQQAVLATGDRTYKQQVLNWLTKAGPFWTEDRALNPDDYFHFDGTDVTDMGLGEAARRRLLEIAVGVFSFTGSIPAFGRTPIVVHHGLPEEPFGNVEVENCWTIERLAEQTIATPESWAQMLDSASVQFERLRLADYIIDGLSSSPFQRSICGDVLDRLRVLNRIARELSPRSSLSERGVELWQTFCVGDKAWFSDESPNDKRYFKHDLRFPDPDDNANRLDCTWHGKVKIAQFRIHFEWPRPVGHEHLKVVYIGTKITKH